MVWLDGPRKEKADSKGVRADALTMRQKMLLAGQEIEEPSPPKGGAYLWRAFWKLHKRRGTSGYGPCPISWQEVCAWAEMTRAYLSPWEARALMEMDDAYMDAWGDLDENTKRPGEAVTPPSGKDIMSAFVAAFGPKNNSAGKHGR